MAKPQLLVVHHHSQKECADGRRCDTQQEDPNSDESKFASFFTEHFNELATYYPILARLKELYKIQLVAKVMKEKLQSVVQLTLDGIQNLTSFSIGRMGLALVSIPTLIACRKYIQPPNKTRKQKRKSRSTKYVPSTFFRGRNQRCTGGVVLQPKPSSMTSQRQRTYVCRKCCSTPPTSHTVRSVDQILYASSNQVNESHFNMPKTNSSATKSVNQMLHDDLDLGMDEMQKSSTATTSVDQALQSLEESSSTEALDSDFVSEGIRTSIRKSSVAALVAGNPIVSVCATAARATKNSGAEASKPVSSHNVSGAIKGVDQVIHDEVYLARRQSPNYTRSRAHATQSIDQSMHNNNAHKVTFQATKSTDQSLHDGQGNPICKVCLYPKYPSESMTSTMHPKGVKLAPMITRKQLSTATSTSHSLFEECTSIYLKLGTPGPSIDQLKLFQSLQKIQWKPNKVAQVIPWTNPQPLNKSSPSFTVNTNKWKHLLL